MSFSLRARDSNPVAAIPGPGRLGSRVSLWGSWVLFEVSSLRRIDPRPWVVGQRGLGVFEVVLLASLIHCLPPTFDFAVVQFPAIFPLLAVVQFPAISLPLAAAHPPAPHHAPNPATATSAPAVLYPAHPGPTASPPTVHPPVQQAV